MKPRAITRMARASRVGAAAGAAVLATRFAWVAVMTTMSSAARDVDRDSALGETSAQVVVVRARPDGGRPAEGESVRMTFSVLVGGDRADVYIGGRKVGLTPYVGDVPCKRRSTVKVEVVPAQGPPLVFSRQCRPGIARLTEPDPPGAVVP